LLGANSLARARFLARRPLRLRPRRRRRRRPSVPSNGIDLRASARTTRVASVASNCNSHHHHHHRVHTRVLAAYTRSSRREARRDTRARVHRWASGLTRTCRATHAQDCQSSGAVNARVCTCVHAALARAYTRSPALRVPRARTAASPGATCSGTCLGRR